MRSYLQHITRFAAAGIAAVVLAADAPALTPPVVPSAIAVPAGNEAFAVGHATGTQGYICLPTSTGSFAWTGSPPSNNSRPEAILLNGNLKEIITHFLSANPQETSPNPFENGKPRPTWQAVVDNSTVWGNKVMGGSVSPGTGVDSCPNTGSIPCLLLQAVGSQAGPTGGTRLSVTTYVQRLNTYGGSAPPSPQSENCTECCAVSTDVGNQLLVPYTADYWFYKPQD